MNNLVDKFFKDKLGNLSIEPGANAWSRVSAGLTKKNKTIIWFRAAAALLITGLGLLLWFYSNRNGSANETVAQSVQLQPTIEEVVVSESLRKEETEDKEREASHIRAERSKALIADKGENKKSNSNSDKQSSVIKLTSEPIVAVIMIEPDQIDEVPLQEEDPLAIYINKPIVIVYELKDVTKKPESTFDMDLSPERKTGLKKVLEIANDVRTGENPVGGLRQAKDEIFAFNFRKEVKNNK